MTEKELDSMATVQMKQEYAPSEVYSTTSEPPPAYKRRSNSVQIAKIVAFTIIVSSFVIGSFILASTYLQARASCDQMQALDSVLEKELMLETLQQVNKELPRAEALLGKENEEMDLQSIDREEPVKKEDKSEQEATPIDNESETDSSFSDSDESDDLQKNHFKVPLELDLSDLAAALLENNQKSRMNCVIERKHAEELVDSPARSMQLPFGVNLTTDPKKQRITGERISISCDSGSDNDDKRSNEDSEQVRPIFFPFQRMPIPFGAQPQQVPLTHMPQQMSSQPMMHQIPPPFQQMPMRPQIPPQFMQAPHPEPQVRIQVQRIPIREFQIPQEIQEQLMGNRNEMNQQQMPQIQVQRVPLGLALQRAGITPDDLRNIQRMAEERITEELRHLAAEESASNSETADSSEQQEDSQSNEQSIPTQQPAEPQLSLHPPMQEPQMLQMGRGAYGRSLATPVRIPVQMMQPQDMSNDNSESERPHYVQPRSVRSVENTFLHREKRVKRCACDCSC